MQSADYLTLGLGALRGHGLRSALSMLGIAIGIAAVVILTSIGEGTRRHLMGLFSEFGTNVLQINPGKTETLGMPGVLGGTTHKLTIDDAVALERIPGVEHSVPVVMAQARVEGGGRGRSVLVYGTTESLSEVLLFEIGQGEFLPPGDPNRGSPVVVLGPRLREELFGDRNALGQFVRVAGFRLRVIGVMAPKGRMLGIDIDDAAYVPVRTAMQMFNLDELIEIDVLFSHAGIEPQIVEDVRHVLSERHGGREDFTIMTQTAMLEVFDSVMDVITTAVGAIGAISLLVGAIGILTIMWIAVTERTQEIGLMRALGATPGQVQGVFLLEAVVLTLVGGLAGVVFGATVAVLARFAVPGLPIYTPVGYVLAALLTSALAGLLSGVLPARRAAALDPVEALRSE